MVLLDVCRLFERGPCIVADRRWRNLPIGAIVFGLVLLGLKLKSKKDPMRELPTTEKLKRLDPLGIILLLGAVSCLFLALQWGGSRFTWDSSKIIGLLIGSGLLSLLFCALQWWLAEKATIPVRILRNRTVLFGALSLFFISMSSNIVRLLHLSRTLRFPAANLCCRSCIISHSISKPF